ncbi:MAG TPA: dihydrofolate reductase [Bacteroidales bacterium]|nr:dihydrofolate reductase [Bacteroidales bacterium]
MVNVTNKNISIIVAIAENNAIGKDNKLLWKLSDDLKRFKKITSGHTVIMGRRTFLSLPNGPLPNRKNIVITDVAGEQFGGCLMAGSIEEAMTLIDDADEAFIIGGGMVYKQFLPHARKIYLTRVEHIFQADTFFPSLNLDEWDEIQREHVEASDKNEYPHTFLVYSRKK